MRGWGGIKGMGQDGVGWVRWGLMAWGGLRWYWQGPLPRCERVTCHVAVRLRDARTVYGSVLAAVGVLQHTTEVQRPCMVKIPPTNLPSLPPS